jgi:glycyl-tRNA synthetase beta subunit
VRPLAEIYAPAPEHYAEPATRSLYEALQAAEARNAGGDGVHDVALLGDVLRQLRAPINTFFADVLVMADDPAVRQARLALVQRIAALANGIADLSQLQGF